MAGNLLSGECGGPNPLMKLANTFNNSYQNQLRREGASSTSVNAVQTFDMHSLLQEMQGMERPANMASTKPLDGVSDDWSREYHQKNSDLISNLPARDEVHDLVVGRQPVYRSQQPMYRPIFQQHLQHNSDYKWAADYLQETPEEKTAEEILTEVGKQKQETPEDWVAEYTEDLTEEKIIEDLVEEQKDDEEYWAKLQDEWKGMFSQEQFLNDEESWINSNSEHHKDYELEENNPFENAKNPFEEGVKKLEEGDLISAILLFEEAVRVNPEHAKAWQYLGTSQAENEQEMLSISALNKCLTLEAENLEARMALAVSYTNESMHAQACDTLKSWLEHNPRYGHLVHQEKANDKIPVTSSIVSSKVVKDVESMYLSAARISPHGSIDPDIQVGLGVLFNIVGDYGKAVNCFETGLSAAPRSANLWNKLGATLANSGRSGEAVHAYSNALQLRPGFVRCRYNLGISCVNLKSYPEAVEHFLTALNMQKQEDTSGSSSRGASGTVSESIWSTLRMTVSLLGRIDLMKSIENRDLKALNREFQVHG